jgi:hypothetical protein
MKGIGFDRLTKEELNTLLSFDGDGVLVLPDYLPNGLKCIKSLEYKGLVNSFHPPYTLTNKGIRIYTHYMNIRIEE